MHTNRSNVTDSSTDMNERQFGGTQAQEQYTVTAILTESGNLAMQ